MDELNTLQIGKVYRTLIYVEKHKVNGARDSFLRELELSQQGTRELAASQLTNDALVLLQTALSSTGVTQKQLAEKLGIGESRVSQVVNGDGNVKLTTFARYLRALGYSVTLEVQPIDVGSPQLSREKRARKISSCQSSAG